MNLKIFKTCLSLATALVIGGSAQATPNIVQNPGFEDSTLDFWSTPSQSNFGFLLDSSSPHSGAQSVRNNACAFGCLSTISQSLVTNPGSSYDLSFFAFTSNVNTAFPEVGVLWDGRSVFDQKIAAGGPWVKYTVPGLVASGPTTSLEFTVGPAGVLHLDDVSVSAPMVPEPSTLGLMLSGLATIGALARQRRSA